LRGFPGWSTVGDRISCDSLTRVLPFLRLLGRLGLLSSHPQRVVPAGELLLGQLGRGRAAMVYREGGDERSSAAMGGRRRLPITHSSAGGVGCQDGAPLRASSIRIANPDG
jgi:hypothetical protein